MYSCSRRIPVLTTPAALQIAALQHDVAQIKQHTGISFPAFNPDMQFAESLV